MKENLIGGQWHAGSNGIVENQNPSNTSDIVASFYRASASDAEQAIGFAAEAFRSWRRSSVQDRSNVLDAAGSKIIARKEELGRLLAREEGKSIAEATGEVVRSGQIFKFFAGEALRIRGDLMASVRPGVDVEVTREPVGVVGIITPWNFPIAIPAWKAAPALAFGNCVVMKPAELVPSSAHILAEVLVESGIPDGVFNLLVGSGSEVGQALVDSELVNAISFTGSAQVGSSIAVQAARSGKRFQLEMGGKNPLVVVGDADLDNAVEIAINGAFFSTGQRCTASSRIIVTKDVYDQFVDKMRTRMESLRVGDPLDSSTDIGPVCYDGQLQQNLDYVALASDEGCEVIGGRRLSLETDGYFMQPAMFVNATNEMRVCQEEIFGPTASMIRAEDYDHALDIANDTPFGLSAGICTSSLSTASHFKKESQAGMVMVNLPTAGVDYHVPFGGTKQSSQGPREQGTYAKEFYTTVKTGYIAA